MTFQVFQPFQALRPFTTPVGGDGRIRQPVLLTDSLGNVLVDATAKPLTQGFRRVTPQE